MAVCDGFEYWHIGFSHGAHPERVALLMCHVGELVGWCECAWHEIEFNGVADDGEMSDAIDDCETKHLVDWV